MSAEWLRYINQGATRNQPIDSRLVEAFNFLPELDLAMEVFSGGQPARGSGLARVGSTRHDHGNAADVFFRRGDERLSWTNPEHVPVFQDIVRRAREAGVTGFGAGPGYMQPGSMHVGYGPPGVWGAGGRSANAPSWLREAFEGSAGAAPQMVASRPDTGRAMPAFAEMAQASTAPVSAQRAAAPQAPGTPAPALGPGRHVAEHQVGQMQQAFGDLIAPQAPPSFGGFIDNYARQRQQQSAEEEHNARLARLAALFQAMDA